MQYVWWLVSAVAGMACGSFLAAPAVIVLRFGIPFTLRLRSEGALKDFRPLWYYLGSLAVLPTLFAAAAYGMHHWLPEQTTGFWGGVALVMLLGAGRFGANEANVADYLEQNAASIDTSRLPFAAAPTSPKPEIAAAQVVVRAYGTVLESSRSVILSEDLLPGPKEQVKKALLLAAESARDAGRDDVLQQLKIAYGSLGNFVSPQDAEVASRFDQLASSVPDASAEDLTRVADEMALLPMSEIQRRSNAEYSELLIEFDAALGLSSGRRSATHAPPTA